MAKDKPPRIEGGLNMLRQVNWFTTPDQLHAIADKMEKAPKKKIGDSLNVEVITYGDLVLRINSTQDYENEKLA